MDWGEGEEHDIWEDWIVRKEEMSKKSDWLNSKEDPLPNLRLKQMELNFRKVLDSKSMTGVVVEVVVAVPEVEQKLNTNPEPAGQERKVEGTSDTDQSTTQAQNSQPQPQSCQPKSNGAGMKNITPTPKTGTPTQYVRRTGKMTKKEKKELASKNTKMTDWMGKRAKPLQPVQEQNMAMELEMDWEVARDVDRAWRKMLAKSKTDE